MAAKKPKPVNPEEIRRLDLTARWLLGLPLEEICDNEIRSTLDTCAQTWGSHETGLKQSIFYIRTTFRSHLEKMYRENQEFFDANLLQLS